MSRLSVNVNDETADALRTLAERRGVSVTETVRRAVSVYDFLEKRQANGEQIRVVDDAGAITNVELLP